MIGIVLGAPGPLIGPSRSIAPSSQVRSQTALVTRASPVRATQSAQIVTTGAKGQAPQASSAPRGIPTPGAGFSSGGSTTPAPSQPGVTAQTGPAYVAQATNAASAAASSPAPSSSDTTTPAGPDSSTAPPTQGTSAPTSTSAAMPTASASPTAAASSPSSGIPTIAIVLGVGVLLAAGGYAAYRRGWFRR